MTEQIIMGQYRFDPYQPSGIHLHGCLQCGGSVAELKRRVEELEQRVRDLESRP